MSRVRKMYTSDSIWSVVRNAFSEFLLLPTIIILAFVGMAWFSYNIDHAKIPWLEPARLFLRNHVFADPEATSGLLRAIVSGSLTITSLTTTLLLVIVQQSAGSMTTQVFDQFLRRTTNQFYLGFFVGLALYSMITLSTVNDPFNPVWGGTFAFVFTAGALYLLVLLMYTTVNQMRPSEIINAIFERILAARKRQEKMLDHVCCRPAPTIEKTGELSCEKGGFLNYINAQKLSQQLKAQAPGGVVVFCYSIGDYVAFGETLATLHNTKKEDEEKLMDVLRSCISLRVHRNLDFDAAFGIEQIATIGWTSGSTAKSNPGPAVMGVRNLHDVASCWCQDPEDRSKEESPVIYYHDNVVDKFFASLQNLAVVSSESMQHQVFAALLDIFTSLLPKASRKWQLQIEETILVMISVIGDHVLTTELAKSSDKLVAQLKKQQLFSTATALVDATSHLKSSLGKLNSRSTRV